MAGSVTRRLRSVRVPVAAVAAAALIAGTAPGAAAAIPPDVEAFITAAGLEKEWGRGSLNVWLRRALIVSDAEIPGRGNRQTVSVRAGLQLSTFPRPSFTYEVTLAARDEECPADGGPCRTLWAGTATVPDAVEPPVGTDGSVRVQGVVPASRWSTVEPAGAPVPLPDTTVDLTLTPVDWVDPHQPDLSTAQSVTRDQSTTGDFVHASNGIPEERQGLTATGTVAGIQAERAVGTWGDYVASATATVGPPLTPVRTPAQARPYLPVVRDGRVEQETSVGATYAGRLAGRGAIVLGNGRRLPGNSYHVEVAARFLLAPGDSLSGTTADGDATIYLYARQCGVGQAWDKCTPAAEPVRTGPARVTYRIDLASRVRVTVAVPVGLAREDGEDPKSLGTLNFTADLRPSGQGTPRRYGSLYRTGQPWWELNTAVQYGSVTGLVTVAGRAVIPSQDGRGAYEVGTRRSGTV